MFHVTCHFQAIAMQLATLVICCIWWRCECLTISYWGLMKKMLLIRVTLLCQRRSPWSWPWPLGSLAHANSESFYRQNDIDHWQMLSLRSRNNCYWYSPAVLPLYIALYRFSWLVLRFNLRVNMSWTHLQIMVTSRFLLNAPWLLAVVKTNRRSAPPENPYIQIDRYTLSMYSENTPGHREAQARRGSLSTFAERVSLKSVRELVYWFRRSIVPV